MECVESDIKMNTSIRFNCVKSAIRYIGFLFLFRLLLDYCYFNIIVPQFSYVGFVDNSSNVNCFVSWIAMIMSFPFIIRLYLKEFCCSNFIIILLYLFAYVPFTSCIFAGIFNYTFIFLNLVYWFALLFYSNVLRDRKSTVKINFINESIKINKVLAYVIVIFEILLVIYISWRYTGMNLNFDLSKVYDLRLAARKFDMPIVVIYLFSWSKVILALFFAYSLSKKKYYLSLCLCVIQMINFGIDGSKGTFFMIFVILTLFFVMKDNVNLYKVCNIGLLMILISAIFEHILLGSYSIASLFIRRNMYSINQISSIYYDFFSINELDYFRSSFLKYFGITSPYSEGISMMIGRIYYHDGLNANNGLFSDAYSNMGFIGLLIMPFILLLLIRMLDKFSYGLDYRLPLVISIQFALAFLNTNLMTVALTHGFLVSCIVLGLLPRNNSLDMKK